MSVLRDRGRLVLIGVAGVAIAVLAVWILVNAMTPKVARKTTNVDVTLKPASDDALVGVNRENTSDAYVSALEQRNQEAAAQAQRTGTTHVDRLTDAYSTEYQEPFDPTLLEKQIKAIQEEQDRLREEQARLAMSRNSGQRPANSTVSYYRARDGVLYMSPETATAEAAAIGRTFDRLVATNQQGVTGNTSRGVSRTTSDQDKNRAAATFASGGAGSYSSLGGGSANSSSATTGAGVQRRIEVIKASDEIIPARLNLGLNTDIGGIASATIVGGEYHGTVLTASRFNPAHKHLIMEFTRFCMPDGRCGTIEAVAVDLEEGVAAVKGDYKSRLGLRFGGAVMASILEGYGRAYSANLARDTITIDGQIIRTSNDRITSEEALRAASLEAGSTLGSFFRAASNRPPQVSKPINAMIGLFIVRPGALSSDPQQNTALAVANAVLPPAIGAGLGAVQAASGSSLDALYREEVQQRTEQAMRASAGLPPSQPGANP